MSNEKNPPCMAGWCRRRLDCRNYVAPANRRTAEPVENLCRLAAADRFVPMFAAQRQGVAT